MHEGHRKRLLERAMSGENLQDHEILEIILFNPIPRQNTNETAHALLTAFGSLRNVLAASEEELKSVEGVGVATARYLKCVSALCERVVSAGEPAPLAYNYFGFSAFLGDRYKNLRQEVLDLFCLDARDFVKNSMRFTSHDSGRVTLSLDDVSRAFLAHHPQGIVVAHNHPSAKCEPSPQDDEFTAQLQILCSLNKVKLRDHIIVGEDGMFSYYLHGRLEDMEDAYNVEKIISEKNIL